MAVFLLRPCMAVVILRHRPPAYSSDVPTTYWAAPWIEQLYSEGITQGCGDNPLKFCPDGSVTRAEMAVFLVRTFGL